MNKLQLLKSHYAHLRSHTVTETNNKVKLFILQKNTTAQYCSCAKPRLRAF